MQYVSEYAETGSVIYLKNIFYEKIAFINDMDSTYANVLYRDRRFPGIVVI